jgi:hypothetical protein
MVPTLMTEGRLIGGRYRLVRPLGEGGMGVVWSAQHTVTRRDVALKLLRGELSERPTLRCRFMAEARAASALRHPHVIDIHDVFDLDDGTPVMVMELLHGETLSARLARVEKLDVAATARIMLPVISAIASAHGLGIVHRDLKPDNIFLSGSGSEPVVKVLDFGIAKLSAERYADAEQVLASTGEGVLLGTPRYMAPEQIANRDVDHRADYWSIGAVLYECLSGARPIEAEHLTELLGRLLGGVIVPLGQLEPALPEALCRAVHALLTRDPRLRPPDLSAVSAQLSAASGCALLPQLGILPARSSAGQAVAARASAATLVDGVAAPSPPTRLKSWALRGGAGAVVALTLVLWAVGARHGGPSTASRPSAQLGAARQVRVGGGELRAASPVLPASARSPTMAARAQPDGVAPLPIAPSFAAASGRRALAVRTSATGHARRGRVAPNGHAAPPAASSPLAEDVLFSGRK